MKNQNHPLHHLEKDLEYFSLLLSIQSEPSRYNAISVPIENRIATIANWIQDKAKNSTTEDVDFAFDLLGKYLSLWRLYFKNHPWQPLNEKKK